jgi:hypothetical protein
MTRLNTTLSLLCLTLAGPAFGSDPMDLARAALALAAGSPPAAQPCRACGVDCRGTSGCACDVGAAKLATALVALTATEIVPAKYGNVVPCRCGCMETGKCQCKNCAERTADPTWQASLTAADDAGGKARTALGLNRHTYATGYRAAVESDAPMVGWINCDCLPCIKALPGVFHTHADGLPGYPERCVTVNFPDGRGGMNEVACLDATAQLPSAEAIRDILLRRAAVGSGSPAVGYGATYRTACGPGGCQSVFNPGYSFYGVPYAPAGQFFGGGCASGNCGGQSFTAYGDAPVEDGAVYAGGGGRQGRRLFGRIFRGRRGGAGGGCANCGG